MRRLLTLFAIAAFVASAVGPATGQTSTGPAAPAAPADKTTDATKADQADKRMASRGASGKVKSASAGSLVVIGKAKGKDAEWTFALDAKTKIRKGGKDATAADLKEGDAVSVRYVEHDGRNVAQGVMARGEAPKKADAKPADKTDTPAEKKQ